MSKIASGFIKRRSKRKPKGMFPGIGWILEKKLKHQNEKKLKTLRIGNISVRYLFPYEILHTYKEIFNEEIYAFHSDKLNPLIIDCGANIGLSVLYFKSLYPNAEIKAFEPDETNCRILEQNIELNKLSNVQVREAAVWNKTGTLTFQSSGSQGSKITNTANLQQKTVEVEAVRLADFLQGPKIDFLKIDIEGAEYEVIKDCAPFLSNVENLFLEYHGKVGEIDHLAHMLNIVKENNFKVYIKMAADRLEKPFVNKSTGDSFDVQLNIFCYRQ